MAMEFSGLGCLKSTDIFRLMSHGMQMMFHCLDATRYIIIECLYNFWVYCFISKNS